MPGLRSSAAVFLGGGLFRNIVSLYGVQASHQILQLLTIPFLARMLGPSEWGRLAEAQSLCYFVQLTVNYGFGFAATREVARWRQDPARISAIVSDTLGAQALLALFTAVGAVVGTSVFVRHLYEDPLLMGLAIAAGLITGMMPMWFFQGHERLGRVASLDMFGKVVTAIGIFFIVRSPSDGWKMLALQTGSAAVIFAIAGREILRLHLITMPTWGRALAAVKNGWDMFLFTGASSFLGSGNVLLLGLFAPVNVVGYYAGAEKLCRAFVGFLWPLNQAIFPRVNHLCHTDPPAGARLVLRSFAIMGSGGIVMGLVAYALAPQVIRIILGPGFEAAVPVLRLMSPIIAIMPVNIVFGLQWIVPMGIDKAYSRVVLLAVLLNVTFAMLLAPRFGHLGMAASVVMTELFVLCSIWWLLKRYRLNPFRIARKTFVPGMEGPYAVPETING